MFLKNAPSKGYDYYLVEKTYREAGKMHRETVHYIGRIDNLDSGDIRDQEDAIWKKCGDEAEKIIRKFREEVLKANPGMDLFTSRDIQVKEALDYGAIAAFHSIADKLNMVPILNEHAAPKGGGPDVGSSMLIQAINKCVESQSIRQTVEWYSRTALPRLLEMPTDKVTYDTLRNSLEYWDPVRFQRVERDLWNQVKDKYGVIADTVYYDPTLSSFEGRQCNLAEYAYSSTHLKNKGKVLIGMAINPDGFPLWHRVYPGKINHWDTLDDVHLALKDIGNPEVITVVDRKCSIKEQRAKWRKDKKKYIASVPRTGKARSTLLDAFTENSLREANLPEDSSPLWIAEIDPPDLKEKDECRWVVGFNPDIYLDKMNEYKEKLDKVYKELEKVKKEANKDKYTKEELINKIEEVLKENNVKSIIEYEVTARGRPRLRSFGENENAENNKMLFGKFLLEAGCVGDALSPTDIVLAYRERNKVEQAFRTLKSILGLEPHYVWKETYVRSRIFIGILALYLFASLRLELRKAEKNMSITKVLNALKDVRLVTLQVGKDTVVKTTELSETQEDLLLMLNIEGI